MSWRIFSVIGAILKSAEQDLYVNSLTQSALLFKYLDSGRAESLRFWDIGLRMQAAHEVNFS